MKNRYEKIVLEGANNIKFELSQGTSGEIIIRAMNIFTDNVYSEEYANPPIPDGYKFVEGKWNEGFVIERISDGSQFVWIPVGYLNPNGTLDGKRFCEKFGRRKYDGDYIAYNFSKKQYHEELTEELNKQLLSVVKYGGFYISRYAISKNLEDGTPQSIRGQMPWTHINPEDAIKVAASLEYNGSVTSHMVYGAEYDCTLEFLKKSKAKTNKEIAWDSSDWGNYSPVNRGENEIAKTGSSEKWCANNIYDLAGNVCEVTQEAYNDGYYAVRGGTANSAGKTFPASKRSYTDKERNRYNMGFRVALCIE